MLDIGWSELLVVAIVAIVVVGPKDLPKLMRTFGFYAGKVRRMAADFQRQFNEAIAESEADEVRKNLESIKSNLGPAPNLNEPLGKPLMTGPAVPPVTERVASPESREEEPPLPPAKKPRTPAKKTSAKKTTAKKTAKSESKKPRKTKSKAEPEGDAEPKP